MRLLEPALIDRIIDEAMDVLARQGIGVEDEGACARFEAAGARKDPATGRLNLSRTLIERALATTPSALTLYDSTGDPFTRLEGDAVHFVPASSALRIRDFRTDEVRRATTRDLVEYVRVCEALEHIDYLSTAFLTDDVPADIADAWRLYAVLANSRRPVVSGAFTGDGVPPMGRIMQMFRSDAEDLVARPMSIFTCCPNTPLRWGTDAARNLVDCAEWGIPVEIVPVMLLGMISPATTVGALVLHTAEVLSGLTLAQCVRPGLPVLFGGAPATFHMRYMTNPMSAAEALQVFCGAAQIADRLNLPSQAYMGLSDAKFCDPQSGAETGIGLLLAAQCGINSVSGPGMLDYVNCFSLEKLVFDDELIAYVRRILRPVQVRDDLPVGELLDELLRDGHLLGSPHTLDHWREEFLMHGPMFDRTNWDQWQQQGSRRSGEVATELIGQALDAEEVGRLEPALHREIRTLLQTTCGETDLTLPEL
jgi:trimethylamine--corrinoid protein Co-methyltransferase